MRRILDGALVAVVLLLAFEVGLFPVRNSEVLLHRAVGRMVAQGKYDFSGADPFTFTTDGARWVNHSWLYGLFTFGMHEMGDWGEPALVVLKALLLAALAEVMLRLGSRPGRGLWVPGLCTGLAVLALSPRAFLNPACVSYLFLGLTLYLLDAPRRRLAAAGADARLPGWNLRWLIPPLCALWVNVDAWFLLGPAVVALYLVGELLEAPAAPAGSRANLVAVLAASVAACLLNPYHVHAFTLPDQLGLSPAAAELAERTVFTPLFVSPFRNAYFDPVVSPSIHRSIAGLAYFPLVFLGLASFILAPGVWRNWRGPVWLALFLLSAWHARAIPFFAVAAGPITALNFLDLTAAADADEKAAGNSDRRRRLLALRALTLLVGICALAAGSAGWLHSPIWVQESVTDSRQPGWWTEFDGTLVKAAEQVADWQKHKLVPEDVHLFNTTPIATAYLAWYAPGARAFIDDRLSLYPADVARDYRDARATISTRPPQRGAGAAEAPEGGVRWEPIFAARNLSYLLIAEGDLSRRQPATLSRLLLQPEDWTLCYLYGGSAVFGWNGGTGRKAGDYAAVRYNPDRLAFGPGAEKAPPKHTQTTRDPEWWEAIWQTEPPRSAEIDNAYIHVVAFEERSLFLKDEQDARAAWVRRIPLAAGPLGAVASLANLYGLRGVRDPGSSADLYLAVRAARRALEVNPEDGRAWFRLGQAYSELLHVSREQNPGVANPITREVRQVQMIAALTRAARWKPELEQPHVQLAEQFHNLRFYDLELRHREAQIKAFAADIAARSTRGENDAVATEKQRLGAMEDELKKLQAAVKERSDQFELDAANRPPAQRVEIAIKYNLGEAAVKAAREGWQQANKDQGSDRAALARSLETAVRLLILTGEIDEARILVGQEGKDSINQVNNPGLPVPPGAAGEWYHLLVDAASGDYEMADASLGNLVNRTARLGPDLPPQSISLLVAVGMGDELLRRSAASGGAVGGGTAVTGILLGGLRQFSSISQVDKVVTLPQGLRVTVQELGRQADLQTLRGWLALEAGDIETARRELKAVTQRANQARGLYITFRSRALAEMMLGWIEANDHP
jgi:hypothetical protein